MVTDPAELLADNTSLVYISDAVPGIKRVAAGTGFYYLDQTGQKVTDPATLNRIDELGIPPAWRKVWISPKPNGHMQATGIDEKGRKQYRYHPEWIAATQQHKFAHMVFFSEVLPTIRMQIQADMRRQTLELRRVLATIVWLLEHTYIRIGNQEYAKENKHYGLTTLRNRHVSVEGNTITFEFVGKSGKPHDVDITHPRVARTIRQLEELPGYELFQYITDDGGKRAVTSQEVNDYLREIAGEQVSAKDFRTWGGTVLAASTLHQIGTFQAEKEAKRNITKAVKMVATQLRNTPSVCRQYYIHPVVPSTYAARRLETYFAEIDPHTLPNLFSTDEQAVATLLKSQATAPEETAKGHRNATHQY